MCVSVISKVIWNTLRVLMRNCNAHQYLTWNSPTTIRNKIKSFQTVCLKKSPINQLIQVIIGCRFVNDRPPNRQISYFIVGEYYLHEVSSSWPFSIYNKTNGTLINIIPIKIKYSCLADFHLETLNYIRNLQYFSTLYDPLYGPLYDIWNACQVYYSGCVSKTKTICSIICYAIYGSVRFQLIHFTCDECKDAHYIWLSANRRYKQ